MRNTVQTFAFFIFISAIASPVENTFANTSVRVSGNAAGSSASVNIHQRVSTTAISQSSSSNTSGHTKVVVNGQTIVDSDKAENVNYESHDGKVKVNINNNTSTNSNTSAQATTLPNPTLEQKLEENKEKLENKKEAIKQKRDEVNKLNDSLLKKLLGDFFIFKPFQFHFLENLQKFLFR